MYAIIISMLVLLSPLPFLSPFDYDEPSAYLLDYNISVAYAQSPPPLTLSSLSIASNNADSLRARASDTITVTLVSNRDASNATALILGQNATVNTFGNTTIAAVTVQSGDSGNATFSINISDSAGNTLTVTQADLNSPNVFVDNQAPVLNINGNQSVTVELGTVYVEQSATVSDNDPSYNGTVSTLGTVNTFAVGTYNITYSATADLAGNQPTNLTRSVFVQDTTAPSKQSLVIFSNNANYDRARTGDNVTVRLVPDMNISSAHAVILGKNVTVNVTVNAFGNTFIYTTTATVTVQLGDSGNTTFSFTVSDSAGNTLTVTQADLDSPNVFVDNQAPVLNINGNQSVTVELGTVYVEQGVTVSDNDPSYNGTNGTSNGTILTLGTVNTSVAGTYTITYSAPADLAGNVPVNVTRNVTVQDTTAPSKQNLVISSNNANTDRARAGDAVTVLLITDMNVSSATAVILDKTTTVATFGSVVTATVTVGTGDAGNATFSFTVSDSAGNSLNLTQADLNSSNVFVDNQAPVLNINGNQSVTVELGTAYAEQGATVSDNDPSYNGTVSTLGTVNTFAVGTYNITYSATADRAGNQPTDLTRSVFVQDTTAPSRQNLAISSDNANSDRAKAGDTVTVTLTADMDVTTASALILGQNATVNTFGNTTTATVTARSGDSGNATFSLTASDSEGNTLTVTQADLDSSNVFVDNQPPILTLNGENSITIDLSTAYAEQGANIMDNDPFYNGSVTASGTVNTALTGTYVLTYSAPADRTGNIPANVTRTVNVISDSIFSTSPASAITHDNTYPELARPYDITTVQIGASHYALVVAFFDDGVQIINITDPYRPTPASAITDGDAYPELDGAFGITTVQIGASHYALVASLVDDGVQIINITDPYRPTPASDITDNSTYPELDAARNIAIAAIGTDHFALVTSSQDHGVQIINITDPYRPTPASSITDDATYTELFGASGIVTVQIGASHYAMVASVFAGGVQIINITDPYRPTPASAITDNSTYPELEGALSIATVQIGASHYALVASIVDDGVQIINITDPYRPTPASAITDGAAYAELDGASDIATVQIGTSHYTLVASFADDGVQIINITDPYHPTPADAITDGAAYPELNGAHDIATAQIGVSHYALVTAANDNGVQIIKISRHDRILPAVTSLSITSDNANPVYAKAGDTITVTLATDRELESASATVLGRNAQVTVQNDTATARIAVQDGDDGSTTFSLTAYGTSGKTLTVTQADLVLPNVLVDTQAPSISLTGPAVYFIPSTAYESSIPTVTVSDNDPNYPKSDNFVTDKNPNPAVPFILENKGYTYTPVPDAAGNVGGDVYRYVIPYMLDARINDKHDPRTAEEMARHVGGTILPNDEMSISINMQDLGSARSVESESFGRDTSDPFAGYQPYHGITHVFSVPDDAPSGQFEFTIKVAGYANQDHVFTQENLTGPNLYVNEVTFPHIQSLAISSDAGVTRYAGVGNLIIVDLDMGNKNVRVDSIVINGHSVGKYRVVEGDGRTTMDPFTTKGQYRYVAPAGGPVTAEVDIGSVHNLINTRIQGISSVFDENAKNGPVEFSITVTVDGVQHTFTEADLTTDNLIVDTTTPSISLAGNTGYLVPIHSDQSALPRAIASDEDDPYYLTYAVPPTENVDTSRLGTVPVTYAALPDGTGKAPAPVGGYVTVYESASWSDNAADWLRADAGDRVHVDLNIGDGPFTLTSFTVAGVTVDNPHTINIHDYHPTPFNYDAEFNLSQEYLRGIVTVPDGTPSGTLHFEINYVRDGIEYTVTQDDVTGVSVTVNGQ